VLPGYLLSILKKEIKNKINIEKTTFYAFEILNTRNLRQNFYFNMLNQCPGALFSIFHKKIHPITIKNLKNKVKINWSNW
jgi:hypothetical protein